MTSADDALFEPLSGPIIRQITTGSIIASGISKRADATAIDIIAANPKQLYLDAANEVIDFAVKCHPQMLDVRTPTRGVPRGAFHLHRLVDRFHDGSKEFWVACPGLTAPRQFEFAGRFGHLKVWRFAQQHNLPQFVADWFWLDSTEGQLSAVELGVVLLHPNTRLHHVFTNRNDAQAYFNA